MAAFQHRTDGQWLNIIDELLGCDRKKQQAARETMWCEVLHYVEHSARLKIGPLSDDEDARREIGDRVLKKLEANDYAHLRDWRDRQRRCRDHASWWAFIKMITRHRAIEFARSCSLNVARRGEPFQWVRVDVIDPVVFDETPSSEFLSHCPESVLYDYLARFQRSRGTTTPEPPPLPPTPAVPPPRSRRDRS